MEELTPKQIVQELDKYVIGQAAAKRSVAIALRNRFRRQKTPDYFRDEIIPNNILMIGPTGVGKTEIARRLAKLVKAPFIKVEASKFTEVGYVGRDVESMIRDLTEVSVSIVKEEKAEEVKKHAVELANKHILDKLMPPVVQKNLEGAEDKDVIRNEASRNILLAELLSGKLDEKLIELEVSSNFGNSMKVFGPFGQMEEVGGMFQTLMDNIPKTKKKKRMKIKDAREILIHEETQKLIDDEAVNKEALFRTETAGIVFIDEIDKIAGRDNKGGADVSREGVQQDLLPIVEGSTVVTKYGTIKTDYILFIASGAFHVAKPSDLIAELQGRFPIRVELQSLNEKDLVKILTEPKNALILQYIELVRTEGISLKFTDEAICELAHVAAQANSSMENIGARRLNTVLSLVLEDIMFDAPENIQGDNILIDVDFVRSKLSGIIKDENLSSFIL